MQNSIQHFYVATFAVKQTDGTIKTEIVEVPHTQNPGQDLAAAWVTLLAKYPTTPRNDIRRTAGRIESREGGVVPVILLHPGETIRQLFPDGSEFEAARKVGTVIFDGARRDVVLRHLRSKSMFSLTLSQSGGVAINFSEQVTVMRLATELPGIITNMLGEAGTELKLFLRAAEKKI